MALAYTAPTWEDGSGTGISASQLQALCNCVEGLVQGSDKAVKNIAMNAGVITLTFADGTQETVAATGMKSISSITKVSSLGLIDTYQINYTDGTTDTFTVENGAAGSAPVISMTASADATSSSNPTVTVTKTGSDATPNFDLAFHGLKGSKGDKGNPGNPGADGYSPEVTIATITGGHTVTITDKDHPTGQSFNVMDGTGSGDMLASVYDPTDSVETAGGIPAYVSANAQAKPTIKTATLAANATTVTFSSMPTTGNNIIRFYIEGGANYTAIDTSVAGQVTLTYEAENAARAVYCIIEVVA